MKPRSPIYLSTAEAAALLRRSTASVRRYCASGLLRASRLGPRLWFISRHDALAFRRKMPRSGLKDYQRFRRGCKLEKP